VAEDLIDDLLDQPDADGDADQTADEHTEPLSEPAGIPAGDEQEHSDRPVPAEEPAVYGDAAYRSGAFLDLLAGANIASGCKTQPPTAAGGLFAKDRFVIDRGADTVTCPAKVTVPIRRGREGDGVAYFGDGCVTCPLRAQCTTATAGRTVSVGRHEQRLRDARAEQREPDWQANYRATRPQPGVVSGAAGPLSIAVAPGRCRHARSKVPGLLRRPCLSLAGWAAFRPSGSIYSLRTVSLTSCCSISPPFSVGVQRLPRPRCFPPPPHAG